MSSFNKNKLEGFERQKIGTKFDLHERTPWLVSSNASSLNKN
jgi:hypothetical protein